MNSTLIWVAAVAVVVLLIDSLLGRDDKDDSKSQNNAARGARDPFSALNEQKQRGKPKPAPETVDTNVQILPQHDKPMLPPPGEVRIEAVAPRNVGGRKK